MNTFVFIVLSLACFALGDADWTDGITRNYDPMEWPKPNLDASWKSTCDVNVEVYHEDLGFDSFVARLKPGETLANKANLGHRFFVVTEAPNHFLLGNFIMHWNESIPAAIGSGESRSFIITCENLQPQCHLADPGDCDQQEVVEPVRRAPVLDPEEESDRVWRTRRWNEYTRFNMAKTQPGEIHHFTPLGFEAGYKLKDISPEGWEAILKFYNEKIHTESIEAWQEDNTYVNHWEVPTTITHLPHSIKEILWRDLAPALGRWIKVPPENLEGTSIYGIRRYFNGSVLRNHVDRGDVLVASCILNVDQIGMTEPWALQIYDHERNPYHVTMEPGDLVFYESAAAIHGRPFPLRGEAYANVFMHMKTKNWDYPGYKGPGS